MEKIRQMQRGAADLVAVAVSMTILAIAVIGTSSAILYGRQALINQEHYKVAAYALRGQMEHEIVRFQMFEFYRSPEQALLEREYPPFILEEISDGHGRRVVTTCQITREPIQAIDRIETGQGYDYYRITVHAKWTDPVRAGTEISPRQSDRIGADHEISLTTTVVLRGEI